MDKIERVTAVLEGRPPDRAPVSFWHHFRADEAFGERALAAHLRHVETYDPDFLKIMDDNRYPRSQLPGGVVAGVRDLERLTVLSGDEDRFGRQLDLIAAISQRLSGTLRMATTVFNSWTTLRQLLVPETGVHGPPVLDASVDPREQQLCRFVREAPEALTAALEAIAESLARFAGHCLKAGADGIFLSVRDDWVDTAENGFDAYQRLVRPGDLRILGGAAAGTFNLLHVCGKAVDFRRFAFYPVHAVNWADRSSGPAIREVAPWMKPAICAGVDNLRELVHGTPDECAAQVRDALRQAGPRPLMIAPGCTYDPAAVPTENLHAVRRAVEH